MVSWILSASLGWAAEAPRVFPCQNGWAQCRKGETLLDGSLRSDGAGMPNPPDARLGWFDLSPTLAFDPFDTGSDDGVALALVDLDALQTGQPAPVPVQPRRARVHTPRSVQPATAPSSPGTPDRIEPEVPAPACEGLASYEPAAQVGRLDAEQTACVQAVLDQAPRMTSRIHASLVLIEDARVRGDEAAWSVRTRTHLEQLDRSDAALCRSFASWAERQGQPLEAIRWAEVALENRHQWTGAAHVEATSDLHGIRARAANARWQEAGERYQRDPSEHAARTEAAARNQAKNLARAWVDYLRASEQPVQDALALCSSAAGTEAYCTE